MIAEASTDIFNQLTSQYTGSITNIQAGSLQLADELFKNISMISIALLVINHLLRKNVDMVDANIELIRWLIYLNVFYAIIVNYGSIYNSVTNFFAQIASYLGAKASNSSIDIKPENIIGIGYKTAKSILFANIGFNLFRNPLMVLISVMVAAVVMFCFATIALELILVQIGSHIILAGGIFLLAFSGLQWTKDYAERYVHTFFHIGIKMIFINILVGIGVGLVQNWSQVVHQSSMGQLIDYDLAICMASYVYYKLCLKLPDQAVSFLTGRLSMGFDTAADVSGAVKTAGKVAVAAVTGGVGAVAGYQGISKAVGLATQVAKSTLQSQGKIANQWNTAGETIKTLGAASKAEWNKRVDETKGGKLAKNILASIPKPPKQTKKSTKKSPTNESMDFSI